MKPNVDLLSVVEPRNPAAVSPPGPQGAVVELLETEALVEIADENGSTVELLTVPYEELRVRPAAEPARRRAAG